VGYVVIVIISLVSDVLASPQTGVDREITEAVGTATAATLIGAISFIMCLYYFINYPDPDVKEMSWTTISSTISIFCAVLLFSSFNDLAEAYIINPNFGEGETTQGALCVDILHMLLWSLITQVVLALLSGAKGPLRLSAENLKAYESGGDEDKEIVMEFYERNMACFACLCAHITGFASINAFGTVQMVFFYQTPVKALCAPLVCMITLFCWQRLSNGVREGIARAGDGEKDDFESLWDRECEEAENDVMGLTLSFTTIGALRFLVNGCLPNQEGKEEECTGPTIPEEYLFHHTTYQKVFMLMVGCVFTVTIFVVRVKWPEWLEKEWIVEQPWTWQRKHRYKMLARLAEALYVALTMAFSWCFFFGFQMLLAGIHFFHGQEELLAVCLALVLSLLCMSMIIPLDALADLPDEYTDEKVDKAIRSIISSMGLLIGFSWEQCFDTSVDILAERTHRSGFALVNPHSAKLSLTAFCAGLLVPAWYFYMLPFIIEKGWDAEYPLKLMGKMIDEDSEEEDEEEENEGEFRMSARTTSKKLFNRYRDKQQALSDAQKEKLLAFCSKVFETASRARERKSSAGDGTSTRYKPLPGQPSAKGETVEELKAHIGYLEKELAKAQNASQQAQAMLDSTMESVMRSMKNMSGTMGRIEKAAVDKVKAHL
jgi:hypothetical protein